MTGDESLAWIAEAIPAIAARQLSGIGNTVPLRASSSREAVALRADRMVHGYFDRRHGELHFEFTIEDAAHRMSPVPAKGNVLRAAEAISKAVDPDARPFSTSNAEAARAWVQRDFARAVELDSDFTDALRDLGQQESNERRFSQAIQHLERAIQLDPKEAAQYNNLGYARFFAGDLAGARQSFDQYGKYPGHEANALDSQGEVLFMAGQFADAEKYFLEAHEKSSALLNGGDLLKAAYARWLAGDLAGADAIFKSYIDYRSQSRDKALDTRKDLWEYSTGREVESISRLQLRLPDDVESLARQYRQTPPAADGLIRTLYARALKKAGRNAEAAELIKLWPLPESGDPRLQAFLYPLFLELKNGK